jgi:hypothetical protein
MQRFQGGGTGNESRWGIEPLSHAVNSVMTLGPVRDTFSSRATVDGDAPAPVEYVVLDTAFEGPRVGDHEVKSSLWPIVHRLHARTFPTLTGGGTSELLTVNQRDMLIDELDEFIACVRADGERKSCTAQDTAVATVTPAALESIAPEPAVRLR